MIAKLKQDLKDAMRTKEEVKLNTLRYYLAELKKTAVDSCRREEALSEQECITVLNRCIKMRKEAIDEYTKVGRLDRVETEKAELAILQTYLPQQLGEDAIEKAVDEAIAEAQAVTKKEIGKVMKVLMQKYQGKIDAKKANEIIMTKLK